MRSCRSSRPGSPPPPADTMGLRVSVNLSAEQFGRSRLVGAPRGCLSGYATAANRRKFPLALRYDQSIPDQDHAPLKKLRGLFLRASPEWVVATVLLTATVGLQASLRASPDWPCLGALALHVFGLMNTYLAAVFIGGLWLLAPALVHRTENQAAVLRRAAKEAVNGVCFGLVVTLSLYIKLLVPLLRSATYDSLYEVIDRVCFSWVNPLIGLRVRFLHFHWIDYLYFLFFFGMFLVSFAIHTVYGKAGFRRVLLATLLVQSLGGLLYLAAPAVGPFLYHPSVNVLMRTTERSFYLVREAEIAGGVHWLSANAGRYVDFGLAAMPSLHAAGSFVFLYYASRYVRWLGWIYALVFAWILFGTMATRWHYGIDLIAGLALACTSIALTERWVRAREAAMCKRMNRAMLSEQKAIAAGWPASPVESAVREQR